MLTHFRIARLPYRLLALAGAFASLSPAALAQTWDGGSAVDNNWNSAANWLPDVVPANNGTANLIFAGLTRLSPVVNIAFDINSLTFNNTAGPFIIGGASQLTIRSGGVTNNDASIQTLNPPIVVAANQAWNAASGALVFSGPAITLNADLAIVATFPVTLSSPLVGSGFITKSGLAVLSLSNSTPSTATGSITITAGAIRPTLSNTISDSAPIIIGSSGTLDLQTNNVSDTVARISGAAGGSILLGNSTLTVAQNTFTDTFAGTISGTGNFTKSGSFTQILSGPNSYTGTTTILNGTLQLAADERLANSSDLTVSGASATFNLHTFTETIDQFTMTSGNVSGSGTLVANDFDIQGGNVFSRLAGPASLTKSNPATVSVLGGACSYTGSTNVLGGTLVTNALDVLPDSTVVNVSAPGVLQVTNFPDTIRGISGNGTINVLNTTLTIGAGNTDSDFNGTIGDSGATGNLTKIGSGTLYLNSPCTYSGTTTVNEGALFLFFPGTLANSSSLVVNVAQCFLDDEQVSSCSLNNGQIRALNDDSSLRANVYNFNGGLCDVPLLGPGGLVKSTTSQLTLNAPNSHRFTRIDAGTLQTSSAAALGNEISLNGGTLRLTASTTISRPFFVTAASTIDCLADVTLTDFSPGSPASPLTKTGPGRLTFADSVPSISNLAISAGEVLLNQPHLLAGVFLSTSAEGTFRSDGGLINLSGALSNVGRVSLLNNARLAADSFSNSGVLDGSGRVTSTFTNQPSGEIRIATDHALHFASPTTFTNAGILEVIGGSVEFDGHLSNLPSTALIFARDATLRFDANLSNAGSLAFSFGTSDVFGDITNLASGSIVVSGLANVTFAGDVINNGTIRTSASAASVFFGSVSGAGSFPGSGTVFLEGDLRPGNSPAEVEFGGDLVLGLFAHTHIELGGLAPGQSDRLIVGRNADIDGDLTISLINNFRPTGSFVYPLLITADSGTGARSGQFFSINLPPDTRGMRIRYTPTTVELIYCQADFNTDGLINSQDFFDFITTFVSSPPGPGADFNDDGFVNSQDFFDFLTALFAGC